MDRARLQVLARSFFAQLIKAASSNNCSVLDRFVDTETTLHCIVVDNYLALLSGDPYLPK